MDIRVVDGATAPEPLLRELRAAQIEVAEERLPGEPPMPFEEAVGRFRHPGGGTRALWVSYEHSEIAGYAQLVVRSSEFAQIELGVRPRFRRRGIGSALLAEIVEAMRVSCVASAFGHHATPAGAAFAAKHRARDGQRDVRATLRLAEAKLGPRPLPDGVELRSWVGRTPDELLDSYTRARQSMDDAPMPDGVGGFGWTVEQQREMEEASIARNRPARPTVALRGCEVLAFTDLRVSPPPAETAATDDTATIPAARGQGLATAVKVESLRLLREERPDVQLVTTLNAEHNTGMRAVNTRIGFVPTSILTTTVLTLPPVSASRARARRVR